MSFAICASTKGGLDMEMYCEVNCKSLKRTPSNMIHFCAKFKVRLQRELAHPVRCDSCAYEHIEKEYNKEKQNET